MLRELRSTTRWMHEVGAQAARTPRTAACSGSRSSGVLLVCWLAQEGAAFLFLQAIPARTDLIQEPPRLPFNWPRRPLHLGGALSPSPPVSPTFCHFRSFMNGIAATNITSIMLPVASRCGSWLLSLTSSCPCSGTSSHELFPSAW